MKTLFFSLLLFGFQLALPAHAQKTDTVNSLQIENLASYSGQYLSILYVIGSQPFIVTSSNQIQIQQIQAISSPQQITNGTVTVPPAALIKEGIRPSYNFIVIVVHPQPDFLWTNADGSIPPGPQTGRNTQFTRIISLTKGEYERALLQQGSPSIVTISR